MYSAKPPPRCGRPSAPCDPGWCKSDLAKLEAIADLTPEDILNAIENKDLREVLGTLPRWENGEALPPLSQNWAEQTEALAAFHKRNGYGLFASYAAFEWRDHALSPSPPRTQSSCPI